MGGWSSFKEALSDAEDDAKGIGSGIDDIVHEIVDEALEDPLETLLTGGVNVLWSMTEQAASDLIVDPLIDYLVEEPALPSVADQSNAVTVTKRGADLYIPVIYGTRKVGGILLAPPFITGASNEYANFVFALCEGPISAVSQILINGILSTDAQYTGLVLTESKLGLDTQASFSTLTSNVTEWTSDHRLLGTAAVHIRIKRDPEIFRGFPKFEFIVDGKVCYDPRTSTTIFTKNPIIHALDYYTSTRYGKGETVTDFSEWIAAANICDAIITEYSGGGSVARFESNNVVNTGNTIKQNFALILSSCRGKMRLKDGARVPYILDAGASVFSFDSDNIVGSITLGLGSKDSRLNKVTVSHINPETWEADSQTWSSSAFKTDDGGYELSSEIQLAGETNKYRALDFGHTAAKKSRESMTVKFASNFMAVGVEQGDIVDLTEEAYGITSKLFRVANKTTDLMSGKISFVLSEHFDSFYTRTVPDEQVTPADTGLPNPMVIPAAVTGLALNTGGDVDEEASSAIMATWDKSTDVFFKEYIIYITVGGDTSSFAAKENKYTISPVILGESYTIAVSVSNGFVESQKASTSIIAAETNKLYAKRASLVESVIRSDGLDVSYISSCKYQNGYFYLSGSNGGAGRNGTSLRSKNGIIFKSTGLVVSDQAFFDTTDKGFAVVVVGSDSIGNEVMHRSISGDSLSFSPVSLPTLSNGLVTIDSVGWYMVACTEKYQVITSSDYGATWTLRTMPVPANLASNLSEVIHAGGATFLAFGGEYDSNGTDQECYIARSTNIGVSWTQIIPAGITESLHGAAVDPYTGRIVAVGDNGVIISSTDDGLTWTKETNPNEGLDHKKLTGVCFANGMGWASGVDKVYVSIKNDGVWELVMDDETDFYGAASNGEVAVFGGTHGSILDSVVMRTQI